MNATTLLLLSTVVPGLAVQRTAREPAPSADRSSVPVDVSAALPTGSSTPLDCLESLADQAAGGCLTASSTPTLGRLYPYPGLDNLFAPPAFVGGGQDNQAPGPWSTVGGGRDNTASGYASSGRLAGYATVGGGFCNTASGTWGTVAGGAGNTASGVGATVGGGGGKPTLVGNLGNTAAGRGSTIGGGFRNGTTGNLATIAGGSDNAATAVLATIGGGTRNAVSGQHATVAGGQYNTASGFGAAIGGGGGLGPLFSRYGHVASGYFATVPGGRENTASGDYTFAAGRRARATHDGAFVWGDSFDGDKASSVADEFNVYASGGVRLFTNSAATAGVLLAPGGSTWTMVSDRDAKENVEPVDARAVLDAVSRLPLSTWNYKDQDDSVRHMGPMAQDFHAAFGLGLGDKTIDTIDPNGVALAAIQGLNAELEERLAQKDAEIAANEKRIEQLEAKLSELASRLEEQIAGR